MVIVAAVFAGRTLLRATSGILLRKKASWG